MENIDVSIQITDYKSLSSLFSLLDLIFSNFVNSKIKFEINLINNKESDLMEKIKEKFPSFFLFVFVYKYDLNDFSPSKFLAAKARGKFLLFFSSTISSKVEQIEKKYFLRRILFNPYYRVFAGGKTSFRIIKVLKNNYFYNFKNQPVATFISGILIFIDKEIFYKIGGFDDCNISSAIMEKFSKSEYQIVYSPLPKIETINYLLSIKEKIFPEYKLLLSASNKKQSLLSMKDDFEKIFSDEWKKRNEKKEKKLC